MPKKSVRRSRKPKSICKSRLSEKIAINMKEYKQGLYKSPKQAVAVSYSQVLKKYPKCRKSLRRSRVKRST
jgi:hypothetical protein